MPSVEGVDDGHGYGVRGTSSRENGFGVFGRSERGTGLRGAGVKGENDNGDGVFGISKGGVGVRAESNRNIGVSSFSHGSFGVFGFSDSSFGVFGFSATNSGVFGTGQVGVSGESTTGTGIYGHSGSGTAAFLEGNVEVTGTINKAAVRFKIDHPLDPANKYLCHSSVESPDMKNIYDGVVMLDNKGEAEIDLPDWFGILNKDFRYQLTAIGAPGPNLYIAEEISDTTTTINYSSSSNNNNNNSHFKIAGGASGMKVSWQVTGIRKDPWANANRIQVEEEKPDKERGYYLHPDLYGQPEERGISHLIFPKDKREELARAAYK
jgi:hypothetical protein